MCDWIAVADKKPDEGAIVVVSAVDEGGDRQMYVAEYVELPDAKRYKGEFDGPDFYDFRQGFRLAPSHWMAIPKPPEVAA
jgi:hypothetical protein